MPTNPVDKTASVHQSMPSATAIRLRNVLVSSEDVTALVVVQTDITREDGKLVAC
jgi:hypothetical protein